MQHGRTHRFRMRILSLSLFSCLKGEMDPFLFSFSRFPALPVELSEALDREEPGFSIFFSLSALSSFFLYDGGSVQVTYYL